MIPGIRQGDDACRLRELRDPWALAALLGTSVHVLHDIRRQPANYVSFPSRTGGKLRAVTAPRSRLDGIQHRIHDLLAMLPHPDYLHSDMRDRSHITNASSHVGSRWLCRIDLQSFFNQVTAVRIQRFFENRMRCASDVATLLADLCTTDGHLPTGARLSQRLSFLVAQPMFDALANLANAADVHFTLYVDDLCFSGDNATPKFLWEIKKIVHRHGYRYHAAKCYRPDQRRLVTGVIVTDRGIALRPRDARRLQEDLQKLAISAPDIATLTALQGRLAAAASVDKKYRPHLRAATNRLRAMRRSIASSPPSRLH